MTIRSLLPLGAMFLGAAAIAAGSPAKAPARAPAFVDSAPKGNEWGAHPADGSVCVETPPAFVWRPQSGARAYDLEYARKADFSDATRVTNLVRNVHRPAKTFGKGKWFWRVRACLAKAKQQTGWTKPRAFEVADDAAPCPLPSKDEIFTRIPKGHPRLFARPETREMYLKGLKTTYAKEWAYLQRWCRQILKNPPSTEEPPLYTAEESHKVNDEAWKRRWGSNYIRVAKITQQMSTLAFRWWLDRDEASGALAQRIMTDLLTWDPKGASGYRYNDEAGMPYFAQTARTYTFLHDRLSEAERAKCREVMRVRGEEMFRHLYPRILWTPYASHSQRAWHFLGEGCVAFYGEIPESREWLENVIDTYSCVYPVWGDDDGGWHEGTSYWASYMGRFMRWSDTMRLDLGLNPFEKPFYRHVGDYVLYQEIPGGKGPGFADCANLTMTSGFASMMGLLAASAQNPCWQWYAEQGASGSVLWMSPYVEFARASLPRPKAKVPTDIPQSKLFRGVGLAAMNRTLLSASNNVQVLFKCAPRFGSCSHGYDANNSFNLNAYGDRLFVHSGERDCYGSSFHKDWMWHTKSCNCITVGGASQQRHVMENVGTITEFRTTPELDTVTGVVNVPYEDGVCTNFTRTIHFRKTVPEAVLIIDRLAAKEPTTFEWRLHTTANPFEVADQRDVTARCPSGSARVSFLWPKGLAVTQTDAFDPPIGHGYKLVQHHLTAVTPKRAKTACFVTLIAPYRTGGRLPPHGSFRKTEGGFEFKWHVNGDAPWTVLIPRN